MPPASGSPSWFQAQGFNVLAGETGETFEGTSVTVPLPRLDVEGTSLPRCPRSEVSPRTLCLLSPWQATFGTVLSSVTIGSPGTLGKATAEALDLPRTSEAPAEP